MFIAAASPQGKALRVPQIELLVERRCATPDSKHDTARVPTSPSLRVAIGYTEWLALKAWFCHEKG